MHKDVRLALELAREKGVTLPAGAAVYATLTTVKDAADAAKEDPDFSAVGRFWNSSARRVGDSAD